MTMLARAGCVVLLLLTSCTDASDGVRADLAAARSLWQSHGLDAYDVRQAWMCECLPPYQWEAHVRGGRVESVSVDPEQLAGGEVDTLVAGAMERAVTVEEAFAVIEGWIGEATTVQVSYHDSLGYPTSIFIDRAQRVVDDEIRWRMTDLRVVPPGGEEAARPD